jgi:hypothetical protein
MWASGPLYIPPNAWWWQRPTIREHRRRLSGRPAGQAERDRESNSRVRLDSAETVHLAGLTLVESFTPTTVHKLYDAIAGLPGGKEYNSWLNENFARSRTGTSFGGWRSLGVVRPPGRPIFGGGFADPNVPAGVDAIWLTVFTPLPSVTQLVATFVFDEEAGDLTRYLRADYETEVHSIRVHVRGPLGKIRSRVPWSRPRSGSFNHGIWLPDMQQRIAAQSLIELHEDRCCRWLAKMFPGAYATVSASGRPVTRVLLTEGTEPLTGNIAPLRAVDLNPSGLIWKGGDEGVGWRMSVTRRDGDDSSHVVIAAARRRDTSDPIEGPRADQETNWYIVQRFHSDQGSILSILALERLLVDFGNALRDLRDRSARFAQPVRSANNLSRYLIGRGMDTALVAGDVQRYSDSRDSLHQARYVEDWSRLPVPPNIPSPADLIQTTWEGVTQYADRLGKEVDIMVSTLDAYSNLRQAATNTILQRWVIGFTILALVISVGSFVVAIAALQ